MMLAGWLQSAQFDFNIVFSTVKIKEQNIYIYRSDQISIHKHIHTHHFNMQFYISPRQFIQNTMVCFVLFLYLLPSFVNFTTPHTHTQTFSFFSFFQLENKRVYVVYMYIKRAVALSNLVKLCVFRNFSNESKKKRTKNFKSEPVELNV